MRAISALLHAATRQLDRLTALPAQTLAHFMDDVDEVWVTDVFMDQPDTGLAGGW